MQEVVPLHRRTYDAIGHDIVRCKLGGGAYLAKGEGVVLVDFESGDFGKMHKHLVSRCLASQGIALETIDDKYFISGMVEDYLQRKMG